MKILHDLNGRPYFEALEKVVKLDYYESSIIKLIIRAVVKNDYANLSLIRIWKNLIFRFKVPFISGDTILIGMSPYDFRIIWYGMLCFKNNIVLHTSWPYWGGSKYPRKYFFLDGFLKKVWVGFLTNKNVKIVAVTKESCDSISLFCGRNDVYLINHCVNLTKFSVDTYSLKRRGSSKKIKLLFVGKLIYEKGIDFLLNLFLCLNNSNFQLTIVGDGDQSLREIIQNVNVEGCTYLGWVSNKDELSKIYRSHDILLLPSRATSKWEELFGLVLIEAMASGLVVISSNHVGPRSIIKDNGFLLPEDSINLWLEKLNLLYQDRELLEKYKERSLLLSKDYEINYISKQWVEVLGNIS